MLNRAMQAIRVMHARACSSSTGLPRVTSEESPFKYLCKLTLLGRTGARPEVREFEDGVESLSVAIATNHSTRSGTETQWHKVFVSNAVPGFDFLRQLPAGSRVYVEGAMRVASVERDGAIKQYVNVRVTRGEGIIRVLSTPRRVDAEDDLPF